MDPTLTFLFYLAGVLCFVGSAFDWGRHRSLDLLAFGLALVYVPTLWGAAQNAF